MGCGDSRVKEERNENIDYYAEALELKNKKEYELSEQKISLEINKYSKLQGRSTQDKLGAAYFFKGEILEERVKILMSNEEKSQAAKKDTEASECFSQALKLGHGKAKEKIEKRAENFGF